MAESAYHNEALRRQRAIERKKEAQRRLIAGDQSKEAMVDGDGCGKDAILYSGPGHFEQNRTNIKRFRLHEDGFNIRYRNRVNHAPHCDLAYSVIYPHKDNSTYTCDENRNNRRMNLMSEKYEVIKTINGEFPIKTVTESIYNRLGTARDKKQYDHSRNGPVIASSWSGLKRELYGLSQGMPLGGKGHPITISDLQQIRYITPRP